jgi:hypothetical protein
MTTEPFDEITYVPSEPGDPLYTSVCVDPDRPGSGLHFTANIPQKVPRNYQTKVLTRDERELPDGSIVTKNTEKYVPIVELLRTNPFFSINGEAPPRKPAIDRAPTNPDQYPGYALGWMRNAKTALELESRWNVEEKLRERLGVTERELVRIDPVYHELLTQLRGDARMMGADWGGMKATDQPTR